jgi:hypothetical protein
LRITDCLGKAKKKRFGKPAPVCPCLTRRGRARITSKTRSPRGHAVRVRSQAGSGPHWLSAGQPPEVRSPTKHVTTMVPWCGAERRNPAPVRRVRDVARRAVRPVHHASSPPPARCVPERAEAREPARPTLPRPCSTPTTDPHQSSPADRPHTHQQTLLARTVSQTRVHVGRHA